VDNGYPTASAVAIWLDEPPLRLMQGHARSSLRREVAGVMLGPRPEKQPDGRYIVHVTDMIIAKHTKMAGASVTYTPETWRYLNDQLEKMYPDGDIVMVGWYHTHPGFGIFLSNMDLFIHTNFFTQKWHIAYVLDPVGFRSGFFSWDKDQAKVVPYHFPWPEWTNGTSW
jgi:proteasome lid subunit RPN8/RPN11